MKAVQHGQVAAHVSHSFQEVDVVGSLGCSIASLLSDLLLCCCLRAINLARIGFEDDAESVRKVPIHRLNCKALSRIFLTDVDYLADQFGQIGEEHKL